MPPERRIAFYNGLGIGLYAGGRGRRRVGYYLAAGAAAAVRRRAAVLHADVDPDVVGAQQPHADRRARVRARPGDRADRGGAEDRPRPDVDRPDRRHPGLCGPSPARGRRHERVDEPDAA